MPDKKTDNPSGSPQDKPVALSTPGVDLDSVGDKPNLDPQINVDLDEFFSNLDQQVNGAVFDNSLPSLPDEDKASGDKLEGDSDVQDLEPITSTDTEVEKLRQEIEDIKSQYSASSREAKRLAEELKQLDEYRDYVPILRAMREDPGLISHVRNYLEGNVAPSSVREELGLNEDFVFDFDEAVNDPRSESSRVLNSMVDKAVAHRLKQHTDTQRKEIDQREAIRSFKDKMKLSDEEVEDLIAWANRQPLTLDHVYYLKTREEREKEIAKKAVEEREEQMKRMAGRSSSLGAVGSSQEPVDQDREVFKAIKKAFDTGNIFG